MLWSGAKDLLEVRVLCPRCTSPRRQDRPFKRAKSRCSNPANRNKSFANPLHSASCARVVQPPTPNHLPSATVPSRMAITFSIYGTYTSERKTAFDTPVKQRLRATGRYPKASTVRARPCSSGAHSSGYPARPEFGRVGVSLSFCQGLELEVWLGGARLLGF